MNIGIEPRGISAAKFFQKGLLVATAANVFADVIGIGQRENDEVMAFAVTERARAGGFGLFVLGLAVNDGSGVSRRS